MARIAQKNAAETERSIRHMATVLFFERGYHGTTMREIANSAGIQAGSVYNHYASKHELFVAIVRDTTEGLVDAARERLEGIDEPEARLRALIDCHIRYHAEHRLAARISDDQLHSLEPEAREEMLALRDQHERLFKEVLADGRDGCGWRVPDVSVVAFAIGTMCTQVSTWFKPGDRLSIGDVITMYADFAIAALR